MKALFKANPLRKHARAVAKKKQHQMGRFSPISGVGIHARSTASCQLCGMGVAIYLNPLPSHDNVEGDVLDAQCTARSAS